MRRIRLFVAVAAIVACAVPSAVPSAALAAWSGAGAVSGQAAAVSMPTGAQPTATVTARSVTVSWAASTVQSHSVTGYTVTRYNAAGDAQTVGAGCSGTLSTLSCTEASVAPGTWTYTVTPVLYGWAGGQSAHSASVTVAPASVDITSATILNSLPATVTASLTGYAPGETVSVRLDSATGTTLTASLSPAAIGASGAATATITLPAGTAQGSHTIFAVGDQDDTASDTVTVDRPAVSTAVIAKSAGGATGAIKQGGTYYVYADVTGSGMPPAGLSTLTADVSALSTGQSAAALSSGTYSVGGQTYNHRSAQLTAKSSLTAGTDSFSVKLTDTASTATTTSYSVTVDNTAPKASDIQTANVAGGTAGKPEAGDSMTLTYSKTVDPNTILSGWTGGSQPIVAEIVDGGSSGDDKLEVLNASTLAQLPFGTIDLGRTDYVSRTTTFGASGTASTMVQSAAAIVITLGTPSSSAGTAAATGTVTWTPSATVTDAAGNAASTTSVHESGTSDRDF